MINIDTCNACAVFTMDLGKRILVFVTFLVCCACVTLLSASLGTEEWITATAVRSGLNLTVDNSNSTDHGNKFRGYISFGLFSGQKVLNYGFGDRKFNTKIVCMASMQVCMYSSKETPSEAMQDLQANLHSLQADEDNSKGKQNVINPHLVNFSLWLFTIISVICGIIFGLVGIVFSSINSAITPVDAITGILGLYVWNGIGALFTLMGSLSWILHYLMKFQKNIMTNEELAEHWVSENRAKLGFSFALVVAAFGFFLLNLIIISIAIKQPWIKRTKASRKNPQGIIMLF